MTLFISELTAINLIGPHGQEFESGSDPWILEERTKALEKEFKEAGILVSKSVDPAILAGAVVVEAGLYAGSAAATSALMGAAFGGSALAAGAVIALPVAAVVAIPFYAINNRNSRKAIEAEFERRRVKLPYVLQSEELISGSVFYPIVPGPQSIQITYQLVGPADSDNPSVLNLGEGVFEKLHLGPKE